MSHLAIVDAAMCTPSFLSTLDPVDFPSLKLVSDYKLVQFETLCKTKSI